MWGWERMTRCQMHARAELGFQPCAHISLVTVHLRASTWAFRVGAEPWLAALPLNQETSIRKPQSRNLAPHSGNVGPQSGNLEWACKRQAHPPRGICEPRPA